MNRTRTIVTGTGSCIPPRRIPNAAFEGSRFFEDYGQAYPADKTHRIIAKFHAITDIEERRYAPDDMVASDLAYEAGLAAVQDSGIDPETLDYIIIAHNFGDIRPDHLRTEQVPALAARVKSRLRIANPECIAYDLPFGCAGWVQAVIQAHYFLQSGEAKRALVIGADTLSRVSDPYDRDSMIYADGAGAVVLEAQEHDRPVGILSHVSRSDAKEHAGLLWMGPTYNPDVEDKHLYIKMKGRKLYEYAVSHVPGLVKKSLDKAGLGFSDVAKVLIHQANGKMDDAILRRIGRLYGVEEPPADIMPMTISWLGNSSVATVPTLLDLVRKGKMEGHSLKSGDVAILAAVGAGMNANSLVYRMP